MRQITVRGIPYLLAIEPMRQGWAVTVLRDRLHLGDALFTDSLALRQLPPALAHLAAELRAEVAAERDRTR